MLDSKIKLIRKNQRGQYHLGQTLFVNRPRQCSDVVALEVEVSQLNLLLQEINWSTVIEH